MNSNDGLVVGETGEIGVDLTSEPSEQTMGDIIGSLKKSLAHHPAFKKQNKKYKTTLENLKRTQPSWTDDQREAFALKVAFMK